MTSDDPTLSPAAEAFAQFVERHDAGQHPDFERLCTERPELAAKLRRMYQRWRQMSAAFGAGEATATGSTSAANSAAPLLEELAQSGPRGARLEPAGEIGRGGMGRVMKVWDPELRRTLAMKVLLGTERAAALDPRVLSRFVDEAQITGQLQHPGIVPVHELGVDANGRIYFTMAMVRGRDFVQIIGMVHEGAEGWNLPRALGVVLRVCEAVAFAHSRGVIHRDLKPANVMVGRFGETYVMDWGLARVLDTDAEDQACDPGETPPSTILSVRRDMADTDPLSPHMTTAGDVIGTPAYMAPEQARGLIDHVGTHTDVYAIGAMLYHLLSNAMPYQPEDSASADTVLEQVKAGPPRPLQQAATDVPAELVAICEHAMQRDPAARYADVLSLADDIRAFLEVRVVRAYEGGAIAELRKWVKRNKGLAAASAAAVLALAAGLVISFVLMRRADDQAEIARANYELANDAVEELTDLGARALADVPHMEGMRRALLGKTIAFREAFLENSAGRDDLRLEVARTHANIGELEMARGDTEAAAAAYARAVQQLDDLAAESATPNDSIEVRRAAVLNARARLAQVRGNAEAAAADFAATADILRRLNAESSTGDEYAAQLGGVLVNLSNGLFSHEQHEDALALRREAVRLGEQHLASDPDNDDLRSRLASYRSDVAKSLHKLHRTEEAEREYATAVASQADVLARHPRNREYRYRFAYASQEFANSIPEGAEPDKALAMFERSRAVWQSLVTDFPDVASYHSSYGNCLTNMGSTLVLLGKPAEALPLIEKAQAEKAIALEATPDHPTYQYYMRTGHYWLCTALLATGQYAQAATRAEELLEFAPQALEQWVWCTEFFARAAAAARADPDLTDAERATAYQTRALDALRGAVERGFADSRHLRSSVFAGIRDVQAFREIFTELKNKGR